MAPLKRVSFQIYGQSRDFYIEDIEIEYIDKKLLSLGRNISNSWEEGISGDMAVPHRIVCLLDSLGFGKYKMNFADIGCGSGRILFWVSTYFPIATVTGIDINKHSLEIAKILSRGRFKCVLGNARNNIISDVNVIYCFNEANLELTMTLTRYIRESSTLEYLVVSSLEEGLEQEGLVKQIGKFPFRIFGTTQTRYLLIYRIIRTIILS